MKLKNVLLSAFLILTIIPIIIVSLLLYQSGLNLSKESYSRNLAESINVQVDYISQTIENHMLSDYRFANKTYQLFLQENFSTPEHNPILLESFQSYLESSEDKISVCIFLDKDNTPLYTIGEKKLIDNILKQTKNLSTLDNQVLHEFELADDTYSLGIVTPIQSPDGTYGGCLLSVFDKSYVFKIISSYYNIADSFTYFCRQNGDIVSSHIFSDESESIATEQMLRDLKLNSEGSFNTFVENTDTFGYYKQIASSPWYLVGLLNNNLIYDFTNQFIFIYIIIIIFVLIIDIILSLYFSQKVVAPIHDLIQIMTDYESNLDGNELECSEKNGYLETRYLRKRFASLMKTILLVQHNFTGIYQLYQSNDMGDMNIDIDVKNQTISSNKDVFQKLIDTLDIPKENCVVDKFIGCFCEADQSLLLTMFEKMRDENLSVACEVDIYTPHWEQKWFHTLVVPMYENDRLSRLFIQLRDITNFKKNEVESIELARKDSLTGLYNRLGFCECVNQVLSKKEAHKFHALLFMDMNFFKLVNDNYGHSVGDDLLRLVAQTIQSSIGPSDIACRFGGDEFAVFLPNTSNASLEKLKQLLDERILYPYHTDETSFVISMSIGCAILDDNSSDTLEMLLEQADSNMYQAKRSFKQHLSS